MATGDEEMVAAVAVVTPESPPSPPSVAAALGRAGDPAMEGNRVDMPNTWLRPQEKKTHPTNKANNKPTQCIMKIHYYYFTSINHRGSFVRVTMLQHKCHQVLLKQLTRQLNSKT
jgi:hypothetical protein